MSFVPFVRRWFGAKSPAIQSQPAKPDPGTELVDRTEVLLEDLNDVQANVAASFDSLPDGFLTKAGTRTDANIDLLTGGGDAGALHTHANVPPALSNVPPPAVAPASSAGTSPDAARADHTHASPPNPGLSISAPPAVAASSSTGSSARAAREDHTHASPSVPPLSDVAPPAVAAASIAGISGESARADHTHASPPIPPLTNAAPPAVAAASSAGASGETARADHTHASPPVPPLSNTAPPAVAASSSAGTSGESARADHTHASPPNPALATAPPPAVSVASSAGTSARAAREDHTHGAGGCLLLWGNSGWGTGTNTKYADPFWVTSAAGTTPIQIRVPRAGTLRHLMVLARVSGAGSFSARVRVNDVATALVVTVGAGVTQAENLTDAVAVAQGDRIDLEIVRTVAGSPTDITISAELV